MRKIVQIGLLLLIVQSVSAQEIEYSKKKNKFMVGDNPIAQLDSRKDNGWGFTRSFFIQDLTGKNLISFISKQYKDTLFSEFYTWYEAEIPAYNLKFQFPDGVEANNEKYFAKVVADTKVLNLDGTLNEEKCKQMATQNIFDYEAKYNKYNDSLKSYLRTDRNLVSRKKNQPIMADQFGRIGQGDVQIGKWEMVKRPNRFMGDPFIVYYLIKTMDGDIVALVRPNNGESTTFEKKKWETMAMPSSPFIKRTGEGETSYLSRVAQAIVEKGIL